MVALVLHTFVDFFSTLSCLHYLRPYYIRVASVTQIRLGTQGTKNSLKELKGSRYHFSDKPNILLVVYITNKF